MSADIIFDRSLSLNLRSGPFIDLLSRARQRCANNAIASEIFERAARAGCLGIDNVQDRRLKPFMTECLRNAAADWLREEHSAASDGVLLGLLERVVELADEFLAAESKR